MGRELKYNFNNLKVKHSFPNGKTMTHEEFMANEIVIDQKNNKEVFEALFRVIDPQYDKHKDYRIKYSKLKRNREELVKQLGLQE